MIELWFEKLVESSGAGFYLNSNELDFDMWVIEDSSLHELIIKIVNNKSTALLHLNYNKALKYLIQNIAKESLKGNIKIK